MTMTMTDSGARVPYAEIDLFEVSRSTITSQLRVSRQRTYREGNKVAEENVLLNFEGHPELGSG